MELIVALTITGLMAAVGTTAFSFIIDSRRAVHDSTSDDERAAALRETLRQWLLPATVQIQRGGLPTTGSSRSTAATTTSATSASTRTPNGAGAVSAAASKGDEVTFLTTAPNPTDAPNARMRLFVDADEATPEKGLTLEYQVTTQSPLQRRQLDSTITSITVEYLDKATSRWYAASEAATITPRAMRITLGGDTSRPMSPLLQLPLVFVLNGYAISAVPTR